MKRPSSTKLTTRERQITIHLCMGHSQKQTAAFFNISIKTVQHHSNEAYLKMHAHCFQDALRYCFKNNLISYEAFITFSAPSIQQQ